MNNTLSKKATIALWVLQGLLAAVFLMAGGMKLVLSAEKYAEMGNTLPMGFLRFIGACEVLGALGLVMPTALRIKPVLTPVAALGLLVIMIGAVGVTIWAGGGAGAAVPALVGILLAVVAKARLARPRTAAVSASAQ